jgi:hypothetical protein
LILAIAEIASTIKPGSVALPSNGPPYGHGPSVSTIMRLSGTIRASSWSRSRYTTSGVMEMKYPASMIAREVASCEIRKAREDDATARGDILAVRTLTVPWQADLADRANPIAMRARYRKRCGEIVVAEI